MPALKLALLIFVVPLSSLAVHAADPSPGAMQEMFNLCAERTKLELKLQYIEKRLAKLEKEQFAAFTRVADPAGCDYVEEISDIMYFARAKQDVRANELLLWHAPGIYRVKDSKPKLETNGECWYFRPDRDIKKGHRFTIVLIRDAPEESKNKAKGPMPRSVRGRDPERAYKTIIYPRTKVDPKDR